MWRGVCSGTRWSSVEPCGVKLFAVEWCGVEQCGVECTLECNGGTAVWRENICTG